MLPEVVYANKLEFTSNGVNLNPERTHCQDGRVARLSGQQTILAVFIDVKIS